MSGGYDDRDGKIWLDGNFVDWRDANVHVLTHAMHYASSVFEGIWVWHRHETRLGLLWQFGRGEITTATQNLKGPN